MKRAVLQNSHLDLKHILNRLVFKEGWGERCWTVGGFPLDSGELGYRCMADGCRAPEFQAIQKKQVGQCEILTDPHLIIQLLSQAKALLTYLWLSNDKPNHDWCE